MEVDEPVTLAEYDPEWGRQAAAEIARLRARLHAPGVRIEHIGSTAVEGCEAKPIVDLLIGAEPSERPAVAAAVESAGYESLGEAEPGRIYLRRRSPAFNVHVVALDSALWHENLLLRDHLRRSATARARYVAAKRRAVEAEPRLLAYSRAKSAVLAELLAEARERATRP